MRQPRFWVQTRWSAVSLSVRPSVAVSFTTLAFRRVTPAAVTIRQPFRVATRLPARTCSTGTSPEIVVTISPAATQYAPLRFLP
jgi:hypothetical protein